MLKLLIIKNIALISRLEVEFGSGLTLLTGETGAGKSILVDSLSLLFGVRATSDLIRTGEATAVVEGVFEHPDARSVLEPHGLPFEGDEIFVRREVQASGKGRATLNGALVPVGVLKELSSHLGALHGQNEPQGLLDSETHLRLLDQHAGLSAPAARLADLFRTLRDSEAAVEAEARDERDSARAREMLEYQAAEIDKAALQAGEEDELRQERVRQANAGRLAALSEEAYALLYDSEDAVVSRLGLVYRKLAELAALEPRFATHVDSGETVRAQLDDVSLALRDYRDDLAPSPGRLDEIESRLALIERLKKKYGASVAEVLEFGRRCRSELADIANPEERRRLLETRRASASDAFQAAAKVVSDGRRKAAREFEARVQSELASLAMEKTRLKVSFAPEDAAAAARDRASWGEHGFEKAEFLLSPNPGEELRPLARIASGGELSRILLALKSVASFDSPGKTLVFDEVDAGIGGRVAEVVGRKLKAMAARHQVLCVTHLPQIASMADRHYAVRKRIASARTVTDVVRLDDAARIDEVARMLGGEVITDAARRHAREMVRLGLRP